MTWDTVIPLAEFAYNNRNQATLNMAPYEALYGRKCRSPVHWHEAGKRKFLGPEMVDQATEAVVQIRKWLETAQSCQKSYQNMRRRPLEFEVGDKVFLKVTPMKGVMRFGKRGKLSPRFLGPFEVLQCFGPAVYQLALPPSMAKIRDVFYVSMLRKYMADPSHILQHETIELNPKVQYEEQPIKILDRREKRLRNKMIPLVKVQWMNHAIEEATWELEDEMRRKFPTLL